MQRSLFSASASHSIFFRLYLNFRPNQMTRHRHLPMILKVGKRSPRKTRVPARKIGKTIPILIQMNLPIDARSRRDAVVRKLSMIHQIVKIQKVVIDLGPTKRAHRREILAATLTIVKTIGVAINVVVANPSMSTQKATRKAADQDGVVHPRGI